VGDIVGDAVTGAAEGEDVGKNDGREVGFGVGDVVGDAEGLLGSHFPHVPGHRSSLRTLGCDSGDLLQVETSNTSPQ
jgi:hypothetical protein